MTRHVPVEHDRGRAILIGEKSFGKGSVQQWSSLSNGGGLRVTLPKEPDHAVTPDPLVMSFNSVSERARSDCAAFRL